MTVSVFMGLPFAGVLRNLQFKAMGNPTYLAILYFNQSHQQARSQEESNVKKQ